MVWHLDVGLSFPKSVGSLIGGSASLCVVLVVDHFFHTNSVLLADYGPFITKLLQKYIVFVEKYYNYWVSLNYSQNHGNIKSWKSKYTLF